MLHKVSIFDSTLRDGAQGEGISFSVEDKLKIVSVLDDLGVEYIEAGNPGSNIKDLEFFKKMQDDTDGEFGGLGIEVTQKDGVIYIVTPIDDTPAFRAGLKPKDKIVEINHESILGMTLDEAIDRMQGDKGTKIHMGIVREGEKGIQHYTMKREKIKVKPVKSKAKAKKVSKK